MSITVRPATEDDIPAVIARYDERVSWLAARGLSGQWGTRPFSEVPHWRELIASRLTSGNAWVAEADGALVGSVTLADKPPLYVEAVDEPEVYVTGLITAPGEIGRGVGAVLWQLTEQVARERGATLLRLDCYDDGEDSKLVRYYESLGFEYVRPLVVHFLESNSDYFGALMERRLDASSSSPDTSA